jgi:nucleoside-diphosphate-sugar epimerase
VEHGVAAVVEEWGPRSLYQRINVDGTRALLSAAQAGGVARFVHVSTEAVYADGGPMADFDESRPLPQRPLPRYAASKNLAERAVTAANGPGFATVICRPRLIWGAGDTSVLPKLVEAAKAGRLAWIDHGRYPTQSCHIDNVVEGLLRAAENGRGGEAYFLTDGEPVEFRAFLSALLATQGIVIADKSVSFRVAYGLGAICEWLWEHLPLRGAPPVSRLPVALGGQAVTPSDAKARRELGYTGAVTRDAGLAAMRAAQASP